MNIFLDKIIWFLKTNNKPKYLGIGIILLLISNYIIPFPTIPYALAYVLNYLDTWLFNNDILNWYFFAEWVLKQKMYFTIISISLIYFLLIYWYEKLIIYLTKFLIDKKENIYLWFLISIILVLIFFISFSKIFYFLTNNVFFNKNNFIILLLLFSFILILLTIDSLKSKSEAFKKLSLKLSKVKNYIFLFVVIILTTITLGNISNSYKNILYWVEPSLSYLYFPDYNNDIKNIYYLLNIPTDSNNDSNIFENIWFIDNNLEWWISIYPFCYLWESTEYFYITTFISKFKSSCDSLLYNEVVKIEKNNDYIIVNKDIDWNLFKDYNNLYSDSNFYSWIITSYNKDKLFDYDYEFKNILSKNYFNFINNKELNFSQIEYWFYLWEKYIDKLIFDWFSENIINWTISHDIESEFYNYIYERDKIIFNDLINWKNTFHTDLFYKYDVFLNLIQDYYNNIILDSEIELLASLDNIYDKKIKLLWYSNLDLAILDIEWISSNLNNITLWSDIIKNLSDRILWKYLWCLSVQSKNNLNYSIPVRIEVLDYNQDDWYLLIFDKYDEFDLSISNEDLFEVCN